MKTPKRQFIVEYKSGRRRSAMPAASIWGNTDFKALVRDAEATHPFHREEKSVALLQEAEGESAPAQQTDLENASKVSADRLVAALPARRARPSAGETGDVPATSGAAPIDKNISEQQAERLPKRRSKALTKPRMETADSPATIRSIVVPAETLIVDDVALLEEENRQLKLMLAGHLRQQNLQLRRMLARFRSR